MSSSARSPRCLSSSPSASLEPFPENAREASLLIDDSKCSDLSIKVNNDSAGENPPPAVAIQGSANGLDALAMARRCATPLHMIKVRADIGFVEGAEEQSRAEDGHVEEGGDESRHPRTPEGEIAGNNFARRAGPSFGGHKNTLALLEVSEVLCSLTIRGTTAPGHNCEEDAEETAPGPSGSVSEQTQRGITDGWHGAGDWYVTDLQVLGADEEAGVCSPSQRDEQEPCLPQIPDLQEDELEMRAVPGPCTTHEARCRPCEAWGITSARDCTQTNFASRGFLESEVEEASEEGDEYDSDYLAFWE